MAKKIDETEDPCRGYPKEFFKVKLLNTSSPEDPIDNPHAITQEQQTFIYIHYPDYAKYQFTILLWLYDKALFFEN